MPLNTMRSSFFYPLLLVGLFLLISPPQTAAQSPEALVRAWAAHGGLEAWQAQKGLEFDLLRGDRREQHSIDLLSRRTRQEGETYTIGYDGTDVWITPGLEAYSGNPRFYNGLQFYFFAMPFVLADPGVVARDLGERTVNGERFDVVEITYGDGVGDSPKDSYIAHFDQESGRLRLLLYTVTFSTQEPGSSYNALLYEEWQEVSGLVVPSRTVSYRWDADANRLGEERAASVFEAVSFTRTPLMDSVFERPQGAALAPPVPGDEE